MLESFGRWAGPVVTVALAAGVACTHPLDVLGEQEVVRERDDLLQDDDLADKNPEYDPGRTVQEEFNGCLVTLNKSASVTRLSISELEGDDAFLDGRVFRSRRAALEALGDRDAMPSMEVVNGALKPFNDGLYAAVELGADDGSNGSLIDKRQLLRDLLAELVTRAEQGWGGESTYSQGAAVHVAAAIQLSGESPVVTSAIQESANDLIGAFVEDTLFSRPIGFYTWLPELEASFQRDRLLQSRHDSPPSFGAFAATAWLLTENADLATRYQQMLDLYAGLTNPFHDYPPGELIPYVPDADALEDVAAVQVAFEQDHPAEFPPQFPFCSARLAFLPASESPENRLMRQLLCREGPPPEGDLLDHLINQIQTGNLDLTPTEDSGWYDYQLYALETLLLPDRAAESEHLLLTREYKEKLVETFRSIVTQTRETHVRQLDIVDARAGSSEVETTEFDIYPKLPVEPFPTFYLRTARAYRFVAALLGSVMGADFLDTAARVLEDGSRHSVSLSEELDDKILLLYGLHLRAADSIGMAHELSAEELVEYPEESARDCAATWLEVWRQDPDVNADPRVMVPVAIDSNSPSGESIVTYWAVLGVRVLRMHASFPESRRPEVVQVPAGCIHRGWATYEPYLLIESTAEVRRPFGLPPLTRAELRAICDAHDDLDEVVAALETE